MSDHNETLCVRGGKEPIDCAMEEEETPDAADSRQDERFLNASDSLLMSRDEEEPVQLIPRFGPSYDVIEDDDTSIHVCTSSGEAGEVGYSSYGEFVRPNPPPIPQCNESSPSKPTLCRSLAWSQDSLEERRGAKRSRIDNTICLSPQDAFSFSGYHDGHHRRQGSSPSVIHWEEKVVDTVNLVGAIEHAKAFSPSNTRKCE